jgi:hypothetical protein
MNDPQLPQEIACRLVIVGCSGSRADRTGRDRLFRLHLQVMCGYGDRFVLVHHPGGRSVKGGHWCRSVLYQSPVVSCGTTYTRKDPGLVDEQDGGFPLHSIKLMLPVALVPPVSERAEMSLVATAARFFR